MPGFTLTLTNQSVAYKLLDLIQATPGYVNQRPSVRELIIVADGGNNAAVIYTGSATVSPTNYGVGLLPGMSVLYRSDMNNISLGTLFILATGDGAKINVSYNEA